MEQNIITMKEAASKAGVSRSLLYHYIKMKLLPKPEHIPGKKGRGASAVYTDNIVEKILQIKSRLEDTHSIENIEESISIPEDVRQHFIIKKLKKLLHIAEKGEYKDKSFNRELSNIGGLTSASTVTASLYMGEEEKIEFQHKKK